MNGSIHKHKCDILRDDHGRNEWSQFQVPDGSVASSGESPATCPLGLEIASAGESSAGGNHGNNRVECHSVFDSGDDDGTPVQKKARTEIAAPVARKRDGLIISGILNETSLLALNASHLSIKDYSGWSYLTHVVRCC